MRELKFRAWNIASKQFVPLFNEIYGISDFTSTCLIVEQFTGLRDKNGREIYEGDLLQSVGAHREIQRIAIVSWCEEDTGFEAMPVGCKGEPWRLGSLNPRFWQVIGNIHENPELLK